MKAACCNKTRKPVTLQPYQWAMYKARDKREARSAYGSTGARNRCLILLNAVTVTRWTHSLEDRSYCFPSTNNKPQNFTKVYQIFIKEIYHSTKTVSQKTGKVSNIFSLFFFLNVSIILILVPDEQNIKEGVVVPYSLDITLEYPRKD